jgi:hypothetical protein
MVESGKKRSLGEILLLAVHKNVEKKKKKTFFLCKMWETLTLSKINFSKSIKADQKINEDRHTT